MTDKDKLALILEGMMNLAYSNPTPEKAHRKADKLLIAAVVILGSYSGCNDLVIEILDAYEDAIRHND